MLDQNLGVSRSEVGPELFFFFAMLYRSPMEKLFTSSTPQKSQTAESAYRAETLGAGRDLASSCSRTLQQRRKLLLCWVWSYVFLLGGGVANHYTCACWFFFAFYFLLSSVAVPVLLILHDKNELILCFISLAIEKEWIQKLYNSLWCCSSIPLVHHSKFKWKCLTKIALTVCLQSLNS